MSRKEEALLMSLRHAVDMALGSPEVGAVNFNLLNAVLQVMIHELKLDECSVQVRGPDIELLKMLSLTAHPSLSVKLTDYEISYNPWIDHKVSQSRQQKESFDLNIFGFSEKKPQSIKKEPPPKPAELERKWKIVIVEPKTDSARAQSDNIVGQPQVVLPLTHDRFAQLESEMSGLKQQMQAMIGMPFVSDIVQIVKTLSERNPDHAPALTQASDLWHNLKTNNRLDATEAGIAKVSNTLDVFMNEVTEALYVLTETSSNLEKNAMNRIETQKKSESNVRAPRPSIFQNLVERLDLIEAKLDCLPTELAQANAPAAVDLDEHRSNTDINEQLDAMEKHIAELDRFMADVLKRLDHLRFCDDMYIDLNMTKINVDKLFEDQETLSTKFKTLVDELEDETNSKISDVTKYVSHVETLVEQIAEKTNAIYAHVLTIFQPDEEGVSLALLYKNVMKFREDARKLTKVTKELIMTEKSRILITEALLEQVELIKTIKADKEDVEEALMTKVGSEYVDQAVETKVSNDELDDAYREISETFTKVRTEFRSQEAKWLRSLDEIRKELLDTESAVAELKPFRIAVYKMFGELEKNIAELHHARIEHETAVAKKNVMRNLDCIACDNPVYMKKENVHSLFPSPPTVSGKPSMKVALTFDLESVRKHQRNKVYECISNKFTDKTVVRDHKGEKRARYYGGRHTITTARERLPIAGNFLDQWGDRIKPPNETLMIGTDNHIYRSSASPETITPRIYPLISGVQANKPFNVTRCPMYEIPPIQEKTEKVSFRMQASRHIDQPIADQEAIEEKFITTVDLTMTKEQEHARAGNQTALSSGDNKTDTSDLTSEEEEALFLSMMEENEDIEDKTSDTVLQEHMKMKRNLRKMVAEGQQENIESAVKHKTSSVLSVRYGDDSDIHIPKEKPKKRVVIKEIDKDDLLPSKRSQIETQYVKSETDKGPAPLKSVLKKTSSGQSANGATQSGVPKRVRFASASVSFNTGRRFGSINPTDKQANHQ